jgi:hypothetical protein
MRLSQLGQFLGSFDVRFVERVFLFHVFNKLRISDA